VSSALIIAAAGVAVAVFVLAAFFIGREAHRLDAIAPRAVYELEEAVLFVADRLPSDSQTQLTYDELRELLRAHLQWLHRKGLHPAKVTDRRQDMMDEPVVVEDTTAVGFLIAAADQLEIEVDDLDLALVTEAHLAYFDEIGAIGPEAADPDVDLRAIERGFRAAELPPAASEMPDGPEN
jgi:hypothetical protein